MDRLLATDHLVTWYRELIEEAGMTLEDETAGVGPALDAVETIIALQPAISPLWYLPLAEYFLLTRIENVFLTSFDVSRDGGNYRLNQLYTNLQTKLNRLRVRVGWIVDPIPPDAGANVAGLPVTIHIPYLTGQGEGEW